MKNLLLLIHRIPYPPNKGDKIRSYHMLRHLSQHYKVHLATFVDDPDDWQHVPTVEAMCTTSHFAKLGWLGGRLRSLVGLLRGRSLSYDFYRDAGVKAWVARTMAENKIDQVMVFSSPMAQYAEPYPHTRRVVDLCDVDSDKWRQYSTRKSWPLSWLYRHEADALLAYERQVAASTDAALFVSETEANLFRKLAPESDAKIDYFNLGVDTEFFSPERAYERPYKPDERALVFTGAMDYWPNVDAVQWFATDVFPKLLARTPNLRFYIVGTRPNAAVQALAQLPGVVVTGRVPDVRPYIHHAEVAVAPLRIARGMQSKVLEAMAMGRPVVVSPHALEGIEVTPGTELLLADGADAFVAAITRLLETPDASLGVAGRARVEQRYSWPSSMARLQARLECP